MIWRNAIIIKKAADYLIAYATLYEKEISECLTNGISLQTSMKVADINGDGEITEADKDIGIDYALNGNNTYNIGEMVDNTSPCDVRANIIIAAAQYAYNPSGLRSAKTVGGSTKYFVYNGMSIVYEYEDTISDGTIYYYGLNRTHNSNGEIYIYNAHGDTVQLVKDNAVVVSYTYDAFGNPISQVGESENPFKYCSEYFDEETGTYYLRARYYNPANGRFNAEDPIRDGLNWYVYCSCNPVVHVDPSGLKDYIYTSKESFYVENDWGFWDFLNEDRYYAEIDGTRYLANSLETITLYDWTSFDTSFLNETLDSLVDVADEETTDLKRILGESVGGDLDFKLQLDKETLYLANGVLYNRNEAGNFVWAYFLESKNVSGYTSGALAQAGSLMSPVINMNGAPRFDEEWDRKARWAGVEYCYDRNDKWWLYFILYAGDPHI